MGKIRKSLCLMLGGILMLSTVVACEQEGPAEKAGEQVDQTMEEAGEQMNQTINNMGEQSEKDGEEMQ